MTWYVPRHYYLNWSGWVQCTAWHNLHSPLWTSWTFSVYSWNNNQINYYNCNSVQLYKCTVFHWSTPYWIIKSCSRLVKNLAWIGTLQLVCLSKCFAEAFTKKWSMENEFLFCQSREETPKLRLTDCKATGRKRANCFGQLYQVAISSC